jgi:ATP-dependent Clp protease ATP-binding subunit ClpA
MLFEEIDKASVEVLDQLYFMMDEGVFYDAYQRPLFARGAFIMMTTNAGADVILNNPNDPDLRNKVLKDLRNYFRDSFLNRFDAISLFKPFSDAEFLQLSHILINKKIGKIKSFYDWTMKVDEETYTYVAINGRSAEYGARPIERLVEGTLGIGIADFQLEYGAIPPGSEIQLIKLPETHKFRISTNGLAVDYTVDSQSLQLFFKNQKNKTLFKVLKN